MSNKDIDEIRKKKLEKLKEQQSNQPSQEEIQKQKEEQEAKLDHIMSKILTSDAKQRLKNVKLADEDKASKVEKYLLQLAQQNRIQNKITDEQMKNILKEVSEDKSFDIKRV